MQKTLLGLLFAVSAGYALAQDNTGTPCNTQVNVLTHRNNNYRTGANLYETCLTWNNVKSENFAKLFTLGVRGQVYAQPLVVTNLQIGNSFYGGAMEMLNVVFIATMENWIYAFDADGGNLDETRAPQPLWSKWLGPPLPISRIPKDAGAFLGFYNI